MRNLNAGDSRIRHAYPMFRIAASSLLLALAGCGQPVSDPPGPSVHRLAEQGDTRPLLMAISAGAGVDERDVCYRTPLMLAAQYGHLDTVRELLAAGARVDLHEKGHYTALMLAAGNGHVQVVRTLAAAGAGVDEVEITRGWTALIWAAKRGHLATVSLLLELGANPSLRDDRGLSAVDWARIGEHAAVAALL